MKCRRLILCISCLLDVLYPWVKKISIRSLENEYTDTRVITCTSSSKVYKITNKSIAHVPSCKMTSFTSRT
jgi:hypothetical protein